MYPGFYFDRTMILLLPAVIIAFWAQTKVSSTYKKYKSVRTINGYTGENIARMILDSAYCLSTWTIIQAIEIRKQ